MQAAYKMLYWKEQHRSSKLKIRLNEEKDRRREAVKRTSHLKRQLTEANRNIAELENGYIAEVCPHCETEVRMIWDIEADGMLTYCPFCGIRMVLCGYCDGGCDFDYGRGTCRYTIRKR